MQKIVSGGEESVVFGRVRCSSGLFYQYPRPLLPLLLFLWISLQYLAVTIILLPLSIFLYLLFVIAQPSSKVLLSFSPCYCCYLNCVFWFCLIVVGCVVLPFSTALVWRSAVWQNIVEKNLRLCYQLGGSVVFHNSWFSKSPHNMFSHFDHITVFIKIRVGRKGESLKKIKYSLPRISSVKCYHARKAKKQEREN